MNSETILELAKQAGLKFPSETALSPPEIKFAELIVQECAKIASGTQVDEPPNDLFYGYNLGVNKAAENIKQHFGVSE